VVLEGHLISARWVDTGKSAPVRLVDGSQWSGWDPKGAPFLRDPLDTREGPTCEVLPAVIPQSGIGPRQTCGSEQPQSHHLRCAGRPAGSGRHREPCSGKFDGPHQRRAPLRQYSGVRCRRATEAARGTQGIRRNVP
jgi:hypothetical protein